MEEEKSKLPEPIKHLESHKHHKPKRKLPAKAIKYTLVILLAILLLWNISQANNLSKNFEKAISKAKELAIPGKIELTVITNKNCKDCFDITPIIDSIKNAHTNITKEENLDFTSSKAKEIIKEYSIEKIPIVIVKGELDKTFIGNLDKKKDALIFTKQEPPFTDASTGEISGFVSAIHLRNSNCLKCTDLSSIIDNLKNNKVKVTKEKNIEFNSAEARKLIEKYKITQVPTLILSEDIKYYKTFEDAWQQIGSIEKDGSHIIRDISPPFVDAITGKIEGLVELIMLTDNSCTECYDVKMHEAILQNFGVAINTKKTFDISNTKGRELADKYNIEKVPTIILSKDADFYKQLKQVWQQVGTIEDDGSFIFREISAMGGVTYKDLTTGEIVS